ncbi:MAG: NADPH:quinone oxidoreductase family protein [Microthrixaceae bacterium]
MRAVVCESFSEPEELQLRQLDTPPCGPGQVRVHVWASGVNFVDALFVQGRYQIRPPLPFVPGSEIAGEVTEVGAEVDGFSVGDRVMASVGLGGYADEIVLSPGQLVPIPDRLSFGQAATMTQSYATAWFALTRRTRVAADEWVVVLGAAGGVGLATMDVARSLGAKVLAAASTDEKLQLCIERGAHNVVNYTTEDLKTRVRELTDGGADVVVDPVGGDTSEPALRALGNGGRFLVIGFASGTIPELPANQILLRNRTVLGVDWGAWAMADPAANGEVVAEVLDKVAEGVLSPAEPETYTLGDAGTALRDLLERRITGKVCLTP